MRSSNPVLTRLGQEAARQQHAGPPQNPYNTPYGQQSPYSQFPAPPQPPVVDTGNRVSLDDVVVRTVGLLLLTGVTGALSWLLVPETGAVAGLALFGSMIAGLVLGLVISIARITNPVLIAAYAVIEGVLLGVVSRFFEQRYEGIVMQAVAGTFAVFLVMGALYKFRVLRATPRFTKFVIGALIGFVALSLINLVAYVVGFDMGLVDNGTGKVGWVPILFASAGVVIGALTFILDFAEVERATQYGLPEKYSWYLAFGLLIGLIFLYWQILRLLSYFRR